MKLSEARMKGDELKKRAISSLMLTDGEKDFYNKTPVFGVSQEKLNRDSGADIDYEPPAKTTLAPDIFIRNELPYVPNLKFGNIQALPSYLTEKDILPHEMQRAFDRENNIQPTERRAIQYAEDVSNRFGSVIPTRKDTIPSILFKTLARNGYIVPDETIGSIAAGLIRSRNVGE